MEANLLLERFCYIGTLVPSYVRKREPVLLSNYHQINTLLVQLKGDDYLKIVHKYIDDANLPRKDEIWFTYAAYLINSTIPQNDHKELKLAFIKYAKSSDDLFLFVKYIKALLTDQKRNNFSQTIKKTIKLWYETQNLSNLVDMICINRGSYKFTHKDVIKMCNINLNKIGKGEIERFLFQKSNKAIQEDESNDENIQESIKKLIDIYKLRTTTDSNMIKELIKNNNIKYECVPKHFLRRADIWEALLPSLTYRLLLQNSHFVIESKMLGNISFKKAYFAALSNRELMQQEKLHPIFFLIVRNKQMKHTKYSEKIKRSYYMKKIQKLNVKPSPILNKKLANIFEISFDSLQPVGLRIFVTINLQENYKKKVVLSNKQITCMEAAVTLAFSYYKSEEKTVVYTYGPDSSKLKPIPWTKDCNYKKAYEICEVLINKKNTQKTYLPINEAMKKSESYDLFLIIVPSAARGNPNCTDTKVVEALNNYRKSKNQKARVIFVNLRRFESAMIHKPSQNKGILEICSFDENTPKLINAFALHKFS